MERISCTPRENYREIVEKQGFGFHESYWMEDACYCFTSAEIETLEKATAECYEMYCKAVEACLYDNRRLDALCIPAAVREAIVRSWALTLHLSTACRNCWNLTPIRRLLW